jgi:hypothetical protein
MQRVPELRAEIPALCRDFGRREVRAFSGNRRCARGAKFDLMLTVVVELREHNGVSSVWVTVGRRLPSRAARTASFTRTCCVRSRRPARVPHSVRRIPRGCGRRANYDSYSARSAACKSRGRSRRRASKWRSTDSPAGWRAVETAAATARSLRTHEAAVAGGPEQDAASLAGAIWLAHVLATDRRLHRVRARRDRPRPDHGHVATSRLGLTS